MEGGGFPESKSHDIDVATTGLETRTMIPAYTITNYATGSMLTVHQPSVQIHYTELLENATFVP